MTVLVKGAGVAGLATALELARRGVSVEVVERRADIGLGASHWAGGMLAPYCEREAAEEIVLTSGLLAADWWDEAVPGLVQRRGTLVLANPRDLADLKRFATRTRGHRWLGEEEIRDLEPDLAGRFGTGLFFAEEAHLDPRKALRGLYQAVRQLGVSFRFGEEAGDAGAYSSVVDCRGPQAISEIEDLRGVRGEMLYLETSDVTLSRPVRLLHPRHPLYIVPRGNGLFMLGATMIETEDDGPITARSMMELLNTAYALHPAFAEARIVETGTGIRPAFPDNVPRLVETAEGLAVAGMHRHGFLLAPALAREAADRLSTAHALEKRRTA
ncbi:glycine oxidase ThiO [Allorhizobium sp. NPDC080224]|uniref:Glycine oxidase ThiO n=1 Tax=Rhizobium rosettiformans TaxID=1368430 RepID=A0ABX7ESS4_9HYPH|nr:glycine oxidase ThiO [Rhizobium rosettiformans]ODS58212.1 MAG: glycine oxidase ThiO [Agrobacterium sp. SCN 61-19]QRF50978.1 glycine oxidase ThiO [Rhizobium rosettiformans]